jgi:hypothetical protein
MLHQERGNVTGQRIAWILDGIGHWGTPMGRSNRDQRCHPLGQAACVSKCGPSVKPTHTMRDNVQPVAITALVQDRRRKLLTPQINRSYWIHLWLNHRMALFDGGDLLHH